MKCSRKCYQTEGKRRGVKVTYHGSDYAGQEDVASGGQGIAVVQSLGERGGQVLPWFHFIGRRPRGNV